MVRLIQAKATTMAALAMARFAEWIPKWLGFDNHLLAIVLAFMAAMAVLVALAWAIERLVLGKLPSRRIGGRELLQSEDLRARFLPGGFGFFGEADEVLQIVVQHASAHESSRALAELQQAGGDEAAERLVGGGAAGVEALGDLSFG